MIYYANDADGINKAISGLESVIDAKVAADTTLTKGSADSVPDWVVPNKAILTGEVWGPYIVVTNATVNDETRLTLDQMDEWETRGKGFRGNIGEKVEAYMTGARQAIKMVYQSSVSNTIKVDFMRNMRAGSKEGINSPSAFATVAHQFAKPTTIKAWAHNVTGVHLDLADAVDLGALDANFLDFDRSYIT